jgi:hypothetical protein
MIAQDDAVRFPLNTNIRMARVREPLSMEKPQHSTREMFEIYHAVNVDAAIKMEYYLESKG